MLNEWRLRTTEEQSYKLPVFVTAALLLAITFWAVIDETFTRRPWKEFQKEFFKLELNKVIEEYDTARKAFEAPESQKIYSGLKTKLEELKKGPVDPQVRETYWDAKKKLELLQYQLHDISREAQFSKSRLDAAYYQYEKAKIEKDQALEEKWKNKVAGVQKELDQIGVRTREIEESMKPLWENVRSHDEEYDSTEKALSQMTLKVEGLQKNIQDIKSKSPKIQQLLIPELKVVDRCQTCHSAIDRSGFEDPEKYPQPFRTHPKLDLLLKKHPPEKFACTTCHGGQGSALTVKDAHGEVHHWKTPLLRDERVESSCRKCHAGTVETPEAPRLSEGRKLFSSLGCSGCHVAPGFEDSAKAGPELSHIHQKTSLDWMKSWILHPKALSPTTRMPQFKVSEEDAADIAHYLATLSSPEPLTDEEKELLEKGSPDEGKKLFTDRACIACHRVGEDGNTFAPNLSNAGNKLRPEWILRWLKDPTGYLPHGKMPNMRLEEKEIADLVSYLTTLKLENSPVNADFSKEEKTDPILAEKGLQLMGSLGCQGCHVVQGLENRPRVGAELTSFGTKELDLLFFGYAHDVEHNWWDWTFHKIKNPQIYATERIEQRMPDFGLSDEEAHSLVILLHSFGGQEKEIPMEYRKHLNRQEEDIEAGRGLVRHFNCTGCHVIEGQGGEIAPSLQGEGAKAQPDWLFKFLKEPISIRPWMSVRMPRFNLSDADAGKLVSYFSALSDSQYPYEFQYFDQVHVPSRDEKAGKMLFDMFKCMSCHPVSLAPGANGNQVVNLGPNLGLAKDRLRHDWIARWILEPEVLQPGTKMPTNFPKVGDKRISFVPNLLKTPQFQNMKSELENLAKAEGIESLDIF